MKEAAAKIVLLAATLIVVALSTTACGPVVPVAPTWKDDVRPLLIARCIRCHDTTTHVDPKTSELIRTIPAPNFNFATIDEVKAPANANSFTLLKQAAQFCRMKGPLFMPPPPAEALEDWQTDILDRWASNPQ